MLGEKRKRERNAEVMGDQEVAPLCCAWEEMSQHCWMQREVTPWLLGRAEGRQC